MRETNTENSETPTTEQNPSDLTAILLFFFIASALATVYQWAEVIKDHEGRQALNQPLPWISTVFTFLFPVLIVILKYKCGAQLNETTPLTNQNIYTEYNSDGSGLEEEERSNTSIELNSLSH